MNYNLLGTSELNISEITFGGMSLTEDFNSAKNLITKAFDQGINCFDTADLYQKGENESILGKALQEIRKDVIIATKVGNQLNPDGNSWNWNPTKSYILKAVEESLKRLKTDYIDLYQLHGGTIDDPIEETVEAFEQLKKEGKIRYYGISSIRPNVIRKYVDISNISSVMMQYSLLDRRPEESCFELLHKNQIGVLARGVLAQGTLAGKEKSSYLNYSENHIRSIQNEVKKIAEKHGITSSQIALLFASQQLEITSLVSGIRTENQLNDVLHVTNQSKLADEEINLLKGIIEVNKYETHR